MVHSLSACWVTVNLGDGEFGWQWIWVTVNLGDGEFGWWWIWVTVNLGDGEFGRRWIWVTANLGDDEFVHGKQPGKLLHSSYPILTKRKKKQIYNHFCLTFFTFIFPSSPISTSQPSSASNGCVFSTPLHSRLAINSWFVVLPSHRLRIARTAHWVISGEQVLR